jgi:DMSO reductase anchor subunit
VPTFADVIAGSLFVAMGGLNVWFMLTNRGKSAHGPLWMRVRSIVGYLFIAIFAITL